MNRGEVTKQTGIVVASLLFVYLGAFGPVHAYTYYKWENSTVPAGTEKFMEDTVYAPLLYIERRDSIVGDALRSYCGFWLRAFEPSDDPTSSN